MRENCWDVKKCGRQPGGDNIDEHGVCPAAQSTEFDGVNSGVCAGRFCWGVSGTLCGGAPKGSYVEQLVDCYECDFFRQVLKEEFLGFVLTPSEARDKRS